MNERVTCINVSIVDPDESAASGALAAYKYIPFDMTIIAVSVASLEDDGSATIDINDDGTGVIEAIDASDKDVPGTWKSTHVGGTNDPVFVAAGSELTFDVNSGAAANRHDVDIWALIGEKAA